MKYAPIRKPLNLRRIAVLLAFGILVAAGGCGEEECVTCLNPPPVAPTRVYSESGDGQITSPHPGGRPLRSP